MEQPKLAAKPEAAEQPKQAAKPEAAEQPKLAVKPDAAEQPKLAAKPDAAEQPKLAAKPEAAEQPKLTAKPEAAEQPKLAVLNETVNQTKLDADDKTSGGPSSVAESEAVKDELKAAATPKAVDEPKHADKLINANQSKHIVTGKIVNQPKEPKAQLGSAQIAVSAVPKLASRTKSGSHAVVGVIPKIQEDEPKVASISSAKLESAPNIESVTAPPAADNETLKPQVKTKKEKTAEEKEPQRPKSDLDKLAETPVKPKPPENAVSNENNKKAGKSYVYHVQVASMQVFAKAQKLMNFYMNKGYSCQLNVWTSKKGQRWFRLLLGPYESKDLMQSALGKLTTKEGLKDYRVIRRQAS